MAESVCGTAGGLMVVVADTFAQQHGKRHGDDDVILNSVIR